MFWHDGEAYLVARRNLNGNGDYDLGRGPSWLLRTLWNQVNYSLTPKRCALWRYVRGQYDQKDDRFAFVLDLPSRGDTCFPAVIEGGSPEEIVVYDYSCDLAGPDLRWIHNYTVGMDFCKGHSEDQLNEIVFTNNKRLSGPAIAEHTIAMLLALTHNLPSHQKAQSKMEFKRRPANPIVFGKLKGKTMLVIGLGGIGTEIAWRAHGLGMRVIATRRSSHEGPDFVEYVGLPDELHTLAKKADVVANALPLTPETTGLFDQSFFDAVKPGAIFLSVGRGKSTVTADLIAALESGKLSGAGLDVTDPEPLPKGSPLWLLPNVIITPHVSASGADSIHRSTVIAVENLRRYVAGEPLLNVVDMARGY
jgi:phosphoglycerate dehydrogenase-like enzyme